MVESKKSVRKKYSEPLYFRVDKRLYRELTMIAEQRGLSRSAVCRERLEGLKYQPPLISKQTSDALIKELNSLGVNLNQISKSLNQINRYYSEKPVEKSNTLFSLNTKIDIFYDDSVNEIMNKLSLRKENELFSDTILSHYNFNKLSEIEKNYVRNWLENKQDRPITKIEMDNKITHNLIQCIQLIAKFDKEKEKLWELV